MQVKRIVMSVTAALLLLGVVASIAAATTRDEYVEAVEPICRTNKEANKKILDGVRAEVKAGKLDLAAKKFARAARALKRTRLELTKVEKPAADAKKLTRWLDYVKTEAELFEAVSRKLAHGEKTAAQKMVVRLVSNARRANSQVLEFEFRYCEFPISQYI
jgi:hypothetical protein